MTVNDETKYCWYCVDSQGIPTSISYGSIDENDALSRGCSIVKSSTIEADLDAIGVVQKDGVVVYKDIIKVTLDYSNLDVIIISNENLGSYELFVNVYGNEFPVTANDKLTIKVLSGYDTRISFRVANSNMARVQCTKIGGE